MSLHWYALLIFIAIFIIVGFNVALLDHLKDIRGINLYTILLWVNLNLILILWLIYLLIRKFYKEWLQSRSSPLRKKLFIAFFALFGIPVIFITSLAVVGKSSYLRVFTDETLKGVLQSIDNLQKEIKNINIPEEEKQKLLKETVKVETTTANLRDLVRQQKVILINFVSFFVLTALLVLFGGFLVASWLSRLIANEVEILSKNMEKVAQGNFHTSLKINEFPRNKIEELRKLAENFNKMAEKLAQTYHQLKSKDTLSKVVIREVSTGVALFNKKTGQLLTANESYKKNFNFQTLQELKEWVKNNDNISYKEVDIQSAKLVFIEDLTPYIVSKRYKAWKEIASRLAHDIKNPLQGISTSLDVLEVFLEKVREDLKELENSEKFKQFVETFKRNENQIRQYIKYITDLIDAFNNLSSEEENLNKKFFSLKELLFEVKREFETQNFKVFVEVNSAYVYADRQALKRVFENLIRNAYEAIEKAGISPGVVRIKREGNLIHIIDNGPGIPPEKADTIFLPFTSSKGKGRGLGLFIAKKLVEEHGWTLKLLPSRKGEGAHFVIEVSPKDIKDRYR